MCFIDLQISARFDAFLEVKENKRGVNSHPDSVQLKLIIRIKVREQYILESNGPYQHFKEAFTGIAHRLLKQKTRSRDIL